MKAETARKQQVIALDELLSADGKWAEKAKELKGQFPLGTAITMEDMVKKAKQGELSDLLTWYLQKIDLKLSQINVTYGRGGYYRAYGSDALWLAMLGYEATVEEKVLTVLLAPEQTIELNEPYPELGCGWLALSTPSGHLVPIRHI